VQPPVLIPVTGADLSEKQAFVSGVRRLQTGLNFLGWGLIALGIALQVRRKEEREY
jgi:hypothetical protein